MPKGAAAWLVIDPFNWDACWINGVKLFGTSGSCTNLGLQFELEGISGCLSAGSCNRQQVGCTGLGIWEQPGTQPPTLLCFCPLYGPALGPLTPLRPGTGTWDGTGTRHSLDRTA